MAGRRATALLLPVQSRRRLPRWPCSRPGATIRNRRIDSGGDSGYAHKLAHERIAKEKICIGRVLADGP